MTRDRIVRGFALLAVGVGLLLVLAGFGTAHPALRANETVPGPGQLLRTSPTEIRLVFQLAPQEGGLVPEASFLWVVREEGRTLVAVGRVDLDVPERNVLRARLERELEPGVYFVRWVAVSQGDQGFSEGRFGFAVARP